MFGHALHPQKVCSVLLPIYAASDYQRDDAFKGYDVAAKTANPIHPDETRTVEGKLVERTIDTLVINVKGRMVKLPWHLVEEVKLPPAKKE